MRWFVRSDIDGFFGLALDNLVQLLLIERKFERAAVWCAVSALLSAIGIMHAYSYSAGDTHLVLEPTWPFVIGYGAMALIFGAARWLTIPNDTGAH